MKKQLQKMIFLLFLTGCMAAPQHSFEANLKSEKSYSIPFQKITFVSETKRFDSAHHIENRLPQSPDEIIQNWIQENLKEDSKQNASLQIILHQAEIIRENQPAEHWWQPDYVQDTLSYNIELVEHNEKTDPNYLTVAGKTYVQMGRRTSLMNKEKQWAKLYRTMLDHLESELSTKIPHVVQSHKK
jgi:hypothetical protein